MLLRLLRNKVPRWLWFWQIRRLIHQMLWAKLARGGIDCHWLNQRSWTDLSKCLFWEYPGSRQCDSSLERQTLNVAVTVMIWRPVTYDWFQLVVWLLARLRQRWRSFYPDMGKPVKIYVIWLRKMVLLRATESEIPIVSWDPSSENSTKNSWCPPNCWITVDKIFVARLMSCSRSHRSKDWRVPKFLVEMSAKLLSPLPPSTHVE